MTMSPPPRQEDFRRTETPLSAVWYLVRRTAPDLFRRDFTVIGPGREWVGDITYLPRR